MMIWHCSNNGIYSVKSAYKLACSSTIDKTYAVEGNWKMLWKLKVPPRVKLVLWTATRECLPTKVNLVSIGIQVDGMCAICNTNHEKPFTYSYWLPICTGMLGCSWFGRYDSACKL